MISSYICNDENAPLMEMEAVLIHEMFSTKSGAMFPLIFKSMCAQKISCVQHLPGLIYI